MRRLERPNGHFQTWDPNSGQRIEGETRQCVHCGFMWIYNPMESFDRKLTQEARPVIRGKCLSCFGQICARPECLKKGCMSQMAQVEEMESAGHSHSGILLG